MSFIGGTQVEELFSLGTAVTKNTYTTEAAFSGVVGTNQLPMVDGGYFRSNTPNPITRSLYFKAMGTIATTSAATFAVNLGYDVTPATKANSIAVMAATAPVAAITATWYMDAWYTCTAFTTSSMTMQVNGTWRMEGSVSGGVAVATGLATGFQGTVTADPRVPNYIELFGTWSASAAGNTTTLQQMFLFGLD